MLQVPSGVYMDDFGILLSVLLALMIFAVMAAACSGRGLEHGRVQRWAAEKGKIVIDRYSDKHGWQVSFVPAETYVRQVDLQSLRQYRLPEYLLRIRVHLVGDTGLRFTATAWDSTWLRPFFTDEERLGIESIDERFSVDTSNLKETVAVLGDPTVSEMLAKYRPLVEVAVAGDRIDLIYLIGAASLAPLMLDHIYELSLTLAERVSEVVQGYRKGMASQLGTTTQSASYK